MSARPVPIPDVSTASYALMTRPKPLEHEDDFPMPNEALLRRYGSSDSRRWTACASVGTSC